MAIVASEIIAGFHKAFHSNNQPRLYRAPGRVNLIGEHTDYNLGLVFPIALEMACYAAIAPADHNQLRVRSIDFAHETSVPLAALPAVKPRGNWSDYVVGVARELVKAGIALEPCDLWITSEVPAGAGLSSSAALEIASACALLASRRMKPLDIALLAQRAESQFVGMPCGIMDQYASVFGRLGDAIQIDCRSLEHEYVPLPPEVSILAVNSMVKHELGSSAYRERVAECQQAVSAIQAIEPAVKSLRDVSSKLFERVQDRIPEVPRRRARHVILEIERVVEFANAARAHDLAAMGRLFVTSHRSMQHDYEISCEEIDFLVDQAIRIPGVYGARMTGGGFGGCTVNLIDPDQIGAFRERLSAEYNERFGHIPAIYHCKPAAGAGTVASISPK